MCGLVLESGQLTRTTLLVKTVSLSPSGCQSPMAPCLWIGLGAQLLCLLGFGLAWACTGFVHAVATVLSSCAQLLCSEDNVSLASLIISGFDLLSVPSSVMIPES